jgi:hypothetical protein
MARFWTHVAGGVAAFLCANYFLYGASLGADSAVILAAALLGAVFPDCDERRTRQFRLVAVFVAATVFATVFDAAGKNAAAAVFASAVSLAALLALLFLKPRHRGALHSPLAGLALGVAVFLLRGPEAALAGLFGFLSHLALDA